MRERKYCIHFFQLYDWSGIQAHLEAQAAKGWMLEKIGRTFWKYRRVEPKLRKFAVTYFPTATEYEAMSEEQKTYVDLCTQANWKMVTTHWQMQIFYHEDPEAWPVETDAVLQVANVTEAMKASYLPGVILLLGWALLTLIKDLQRLLEDPLRQLSMRANLASILLRIVLVLYVIWVAARFGCWRARAERLAKEQGRTLPVSKSRGHKWILRSITAAFGVYLILALDRRDLVLLLAGYMVILLLVHAAADWFRDWLKGKGVDRMTNGILTLFFIVILAFIPVVCLVNGVNQIRETERAEVDLETLLPLEIGDLMEVDLADYSLDLQDNETALVSYLEGRQQANSIAKHPSLYYRLVRPADFLYEMCREQLVKQHLSRSESRPFPYYDMAPKELKPTDADIWEANAAYEVWRYGKWDYYYLIEWDDALLYIAFDWEPTPEQIAIVVEKLKNNE